MKTTNSINTDFDFKIFEFFIQEHNLTLLGGQINDIKNLIFKEHYRNLQSETDEDLITLNDAASREIINRITIRKDGFCALDLDHCINMLDFDYFNESQLTTMFEKIIEAINKKKAAKEKTVDVGFWDKNGNYEEDIQAVTPEEISEINSGMKAKKVKLKNRDGLFDVQSEDESFFYVEGEYGSFYVKRDDCEAIYE